MGSVSCFVRVVVGSLRDHTAHMNSLVFQTALSSCDCSLTAVSSDARLCEQLLPATATLPDLTHCPEIERSVLGQVSQVEGSTALRDCSLVRLAIGVATSRHQTFAHERFPTTTTTAASTLDRARSGQNQDQQRPPARLSAARLSASCGGRRATVDQHCERGRRGARHGGACRRLTGT